MSRSFFRNIDPVLGGAGLVLLSLGGFLHNLAIFGGGVVALAVVGVRRWLALRRLPSLPQAAAGSHSLLSAVRETTPAPARAHRKNVLGDVHNTTELVEGMIQDGRFSLLLRPQIVGNLDEGQVRRALDQLERTMVLVPSGPVCIGLPSSELLGDDEADFNHFSGPEIAGRLVMVDPVFLDRFCVTNAEYQRFVDAGGYEQMALWDEEALPALLDFVDLTGQPSPRFWRNAAYPKGDAKLPVVGISWYEASAYARWCGKRLPTDAEWIKAGAWPVESSPGHLVHRRYPWGDAFDARRANVWGGGHDGPVAVDEFAQGASVGGNHQLIGNVWEWTASNFGDPEDYTLRLPVPMRSLRGGAFDTYFENQATCHFQSGDSPLGRKHNIGFRLALGTCDVAPQVGVGADDQLEVESQSDVQKSTSVERPAAIAV
jgi:iron(II)-dependent oxidoreductase